VAAVAVVATLPILIFTFLVQRQLVRGLTFGAVKG
jgi:multiple sugar transport system permease protein